MSGRQGRVDSAASEAPEEGDGPDGRPAVLRASNLMVRYRNGAAGILDVSFRVGEGQVIALLGPNGAGKSTSVRAVNGFLRPEGTRVVKGTIEFLGRDVTNAEPHETCGLGMAFVPERTKVFRNMSVRENLISLGGAQRGEGRAVAMERVLALFPVLGKRLKQSAGQLSGGEQQMLAIARALLTDPKLLILDEMTLGLHHLLHQVLLEAVQQISATGVSVIMTDENIHLALQVASYCYFLSDGRVRDEGPPERFLDGGPDGDGRDRESATGSSSSPQRGQDPQRPS